MTNDVITQAKKGLRWIGIGQIGNRFLSMASTIVLARLLMPSDYGIIALARLVLGFIMLFNAWGIDAAIIVEKKRVREIANAAFWINLLIMVGLAAITFISAPYIKRFYEVEILYPILIWMGFGLILQSLELVPRALLTKEMNYKYLTAVILSVELVTNSLVILLAFMGFGVWSLVIPQIIASPLRTVPLMLKTGWRPTLAFSKADVTGLLHFGKNVLGSELTRYINQNTDYFIIGRLLDNVKLGYYTFAYNLANWPVENIVKLVNQISLPTLSKFQTDIKELRNMFFKITQMISLVTFPIFGILLGVTGELISVVFGEKWLPSVTVLQVIIIYGIIRSIFAPSGRIFLVLKKPELIFYINLCQIPFLIGGIWFGVNNYGIIGAAVAVASVLSIGGLATMIVVSRLINSSVMNYIKSLIPGAIATLIFLLPGKFLKSLLFSYSLNPYLILVVYTLFAVITYSVSLFLINRELFIGLIKIFTETAGLNWENTKEQLLQFRSQLARRFF